MKIYNRVTKVTTELEGNKLDLAELNKCTHEEFNKCLTWLKVGNHFFGLLHNHIRYEVTL